MVNRIPWVDSAKGLGILLVILGHAGVPPWAKALIFTFHMPVFFFLSGYLFNYAKYRTNTFQLINIKIARLIFPYVFSFLLLSLVWYGIQYLVVRWNIPYESPIFQLTPGDCIISLLYGNGDALPATLEPFALQVDPPLWFLPAMFCSILLLYCTLGIISRYGQRVGVLFGLLIIGTGLEFGSRLYLPWGMDIACVALVFTGTGYLLRQAKQDLWTQKGLYLLPVLILLVLVSYMVNGYVDMNTREYQNVFFFFLGGLAGSIGICIVSANLVRYPLLTRIFSYLGLISLFILVFHVPLMVLCIGPLQVLAPGVYSVIQSIWVLWFALSLALCLIAWQVIRLFPRIASLYA